MDRVYRPEFVSSLQTKTISFMALASVAQLPLSRQGCAVEVAAKIFMPPYWRQRQSDAIETPCRCGGMADAIDSKSISQKECGFESLHRHQFKNRPLCARLLCFARSGEKEEALPWITFGPGAGHTSDIATATSCGPTPES